MGPAAQPGSRTLLHSTGGRLLAVAACVVGLWAVVPGQADAQGVDPKVLEMIQTQLGAGRAAREAAEQAQTQQQPVTQREGVPPGSQQAGGVLDTVEEQLLRRQQARRELDELYRPTPLEQDFRRRAGDGSLRQFGYDFFQAGPPPTGVMTGAIGDDYVLGIGDEVTVVFRGATNESRTARVDRDGRLILGSMRPIQAAGRSLGALRAQIAAETRATMLATDAFVSVGEVRQISVFVGGEVERPGQYSLTSLADISAAIAQAGGVRRTGSLRTVRVVRAGGGTAVVDLYGLLGIGSPPNVRLRDGDRVIVPVLGPTVAITGAVVRPGIYELRGPGSLQSIIAFAGGPLRQGGVEVTLGRVSPSGQERLARAASLSATVQPGDVILVGSVGAGGAIDRVALEGHVANPGLRSLASAPTVAALLRSPENLFADTYRPLAAIVRRDPDTGARRFIPIDLGREFGPDSTRLVPEDKLVLFSQADIEGGAKAGPFKDEPGLFAFVQERMVNLSGVVRRPGRFPIAGPVTLERMLALAEGLQEDAIDVELEIRRFPSADLERVALGQDPFVQREVRIRPGDMVLVSSRAMEVIGTVSLAGELVRPGSYSLRRGERLSDLIRRAGGLLPDAYPYGAVFTRQSVKEGLEQGFRRNARELNNALVALAARGERGGIEGLSGALTLIEVLATVEVPGRVVIEADPRVLAIRPDLDTILEPGDAVTIPRRPNFVLALGDVQNPGALQFVEGKPASAYLMAAGGTLQSADSGRAFLVLPDGTAQPLRGRRNIAPPPGSTIIVPKDIDPFGRLAVIKDVTTIIAQLATSVATVGLLATR
jgi:polysaccharide export outer membrane protein